MFAISNKGHREAPVLGRFRPAASAGGWLKREESIMGTAIVVELWCDQRAAGEAAITAVMDEMHRIDRTMSPHKADSELSRINQGAGAGPVPVSAEMARQARASASGVGRMPAR